MGVMLKKRRIWAVLFGMIVNLIREKVQGWRKQRKPIRSCLGSILNRIMGEVNGTIRRFVSKKIPRKQLKPRNDIYTWRHADRWRPFMYLGSGASPWGNFRFHHQVNCILQSLSRLLLSVCQSCGTIWRVPLENIQRVELKPRGHIYILRRVYNYTLHGWRAVMQFLNDPSSNLSGLVDLLCGFSLFHVLLSKRWNCGMIWRVLSNKIWKVLSNKIQMGELECGDHIYTWRRAYSYAHHGIYAGNGMVIHYTRGGGLDRIIFSSSPSHHSKSSYPISSDQTRLDRVIRCSIDDFLSSGELYRFEYGVDLALFIAKTRGGTCTLACSDAPDHVVQRACSLLKDGFGKYHLFGNNCEDFAIYCKTGFHLVDNNFSIGRSGQAASFLVAISAFLSSTIRTVRITGQHFIVGYCIYSACRWAFDIGIRGNVSKAASSRLAEEESSSNGVSIKSNSAFLKGRAWDLLLFATWWICCYVLDLTTEITSFRLGWIILTSTMCRVLFVPVGPAKKENKNRYSNFHLSIDLRIIFISVKTVWLWLLNVSPNRAAGV